MIPDSAGSVGERRQDVVAGQLVLLHHLLRGHAATEFPDEV